MPRISVIGTSGSGKTTLARAIAEHLNIPHIELDALHWGPNWTSAQRDDFRNRVAAAIAAPAWVSCGNYRAVRDLVMVASRLRGTSNLWTGRFFQTRHSKCKSPPRGPRSATT